MKKHDKSRLINYFTEDNKSGYKTRENHILKTFPFLIKEINKHHEYNFKENLPFHQKLYNFLYDIKTIPNCENCGNEIKWRGVFTEGYLTYCCKKCSYESKKRVERIKDTVNKKYSKNWISDVETVKNKKKEVFNEKYGNESIFKTNHFKEKSNISNIKKYGNIFPLKNDEVKKRIQKNNIEKYGVTSPSKLEMVKNKMIKTNLERYGVDSVMKNDIVKNKNVDSRLKRTLKLLNDAMGSNVLLDNVKECVIVKNHCKLHSEYIINRILLYNRVIALKMTNPCILCYPISENVSIKEIELKLFLEEIIGKKLSNKKINRSEIDIFIPEHNIGIEFNGMYWHSDIFKEKDYHLKKTVLFETNNIQLLHVFEDEWMYKKEIVKSIIKSKMGIFNEKIFARKCFIKVINTKEVSDFLNKNHIQGSVGSSVKLGLFYKDELVSAMTFGKKRLSLGNKINGEGEYEMLRFCNKLNTSVIGGASKLLKYFINNYSPKSIISFADRRYSNGKLYNKLGFEFKNYIKPNYWYFKRGDGIKYHRFNFRKDVLVKEGYDKEKTEFQIMNERGFFRIYDCGNLKFELII